jgi:DNA-binding beta-propeller fold protein YncE
VRATLTLCWLAPGMAQADPDSRSFWAFESGHVRPLALSADRSRLYAVNTPDNRLEIFAVSGAGLSHRWSMPTGLEPVAVCINPAAPEVWVVNHLSDDVSVVDVSSSPPRVVRTVLVGDEPSDCLFASGRAFVATARRGQNSGVDPAFLTAAVNRTPGRALVYVFDPSNLGASLGATPIEVVGDGAWSNGDSIFGDSPRPLAASADGSRVYVGIFHSGNRTSTVVEAVATPAAPFFGLDVPLTNFQGLTRPNVGAIVQNTGAQWLDGIGRNFAAVMRVSLPDLDVFEIDAASPTASGIRVLRSFAGVGTVLFNMAVNPVSDTLYVSNTEANNRARFEGPGTFCASQVPPCSSLRGNLHQARITLIDLGSGSVTPRHLNKHLVPYTPATDLPIDNARSLATPLEMALTADGSRLYVAAFGSSKIGVFDTALLAANTFAPSESDHIELSVGGPSGIVLDEPRQRLYAATRFGNAIAVVDTSNWPGSELDVVELPHDPEPASLREGRPVLYDARATSSNGEASCSACHVFGNLDSLAWNLGNPDGVQVGNPNPFVPDTPTNVIPAVFHPMKGPMTTQSLRGMAKHGPMHWRGDRTGGNAIPPVDPLSDNDAFLEFRVAFDGLLGRATEGTPEEMQAFADFILQVAYPPNPYRALSNDDVTHDWPGNPSGTDLSQGRDIFFGLSDADGPGGAPLDGADGVGAVGFFDNGAGRSCSHCHALDEDAGLFGTAGLTTFEGEPQLFKVAHLRNIYAKAGFFGIACVGLLPAPPGTCTGPHFGDQVRGFGLLHDGGVATILDFVSAPAFVYQGTSAEQAQKRRALAEYVLGFPSNLRPIVGQQITFDGSNEGVIGPRIDLLIARALAGDCELVVKGRIEGEPRGYLLVAADSFESDRAGEPPLSDAELRALAAPGQELTYTCAPPGSGERIGRDRNDDGILDAQQCGDVNGDGVVAGADPDAIRDALAGRPETLTVSSKCNVIGEANPGDANQDGVPDDCEMRDVVVAARASAGLPPGAAQLCTAAL